MYMHTSNYGEKKSVTTMQDFTSELMFQDTYLQTL